MIRFRILGAGGAIPTPTHSPAAYWVTVDGLGLLVDPGPGALVRLVRTGDATIDDIGPVLLTHLHPDHCADLVPLLFALHSPLTDGRQPLHLRGPQGLAAYLEQLETIWGRWLEPRHRELIVTEWGPGDTWELAGGARIEPFAVEHPQDRLTDGPCLGYRFIDRDGHVAVFSGDTGACAGLENAARNADLLVVECSAPDGLGVAGHLTPAEVGALCTAAQPGQVVLTHQYPAAAEADLVAAVQKIWNGPVSQARDDDVHHVPTNDAKDKP